MFSGHMSVTINCRWPKIEVDNSDVLFQCIIDWISLNKCWTYLHICIFLGRFCRNKSQHLTQETGMKYLILFWGPPTTPHLWFLCLDKLSALGRVRPHALWNENFKKIVNLNIFINVNWKMEFKELELIFD